MRYVESEQIKEGMILGLPFYGHNFEILVDTGDILDAGKIKSINDMGYPGAYIKDAVSAGIIPRDIISHDLRVRTVRKMTEIFRDIESGEKPREKKETRARQESILLPIIDDLLENPDPFIDIIDCKPYTYYNYYHAGSVALMSLLIGVCMRLSRIQLYELGLASLLHDIGNIFIPQSILNKRGKLTNEEFEVIKSHSRMGFDYLREHFDISINACMGALQHHERFNGTGYPNKLKRDEISLYGRIIAITEVFDALTSNRPFRVQGYPDTAIDYMEANAGIFFDPDIFDVFRGTVALYPSGTTVNLSDGGAYIVTENLPGNMARPRLKSLDGDGDVIDLSLDENESLEIAGRTDHCG